MKKKLGWSISPTVAVFSRGRAVVALAARVLPAGWQLAECDRIEASREVLSRPDARVVIVDDEATAEELRRWLLDRVRRYLPRPLLVYIAGAHRAEAERRAFLWGRLLH